MERNNSQKFEKIPNSLIFVIFQKTSSKVSIFTASSGIGRFINVLNTFLNVFKIVNKCYSLSILLLKSHRRNISYKLDKLSLVGKHLRILLSTF